MIVETLMNLVKGIISLVMRPFNIPGIPDDVLSSIDTFIGYFDTCSSFIGLVFPVNLVPFFVIFIAIYSWDNIYPMVMWVLRKIPFLGIE